MAINRDKVEAAAIKLLQQGKYDKAIIELKKLVDDDKTDVRTLLKLGDTYVKIGNKKESIDSYEKAAAIYTEQGFYLKAVAVFKQILRVDANIPELHLKLAELYQQLGLTSDALQHYQNVAVFHEQQGRAREALDMLKRMVDLDPDNIPSRIKLGELFAAQGMPSEAVEELRNALNFLKQQQRYDDYVRVGEKLVAYDQNALDVARELATIYMQRQQPQVALGKLQMCFKADPRNVEVLAMIAQAFLDMQQVPKTISVFKEMAKIYAADGKAELATRTWERVLELQPGDEEAEQALGRVSPQVTAPVYAKAAPTMVAPAQANVGVSPVPQSGMQAVARVNPEDEQLQRLLTETDVYVKYGLRDKAIEHLQKVFALRPEHLPALEKLKNLQQQTNNRGVGETLQKLVAAAEKQGSPRVDEWRSELNALGSVSSRPSASTPPSRPVTQPSYMVPASQSQSASGEGDILIDDPSSSHPSLPDEPLINLDDNVSGVVELNARADEQLIAPSGGSLLDELPPDENADFDAPVAPAAPVAPVAASGRPVTNTAPGGPSSMPSGSGSIPRMPTGVLSAPAPVEPSRPAASKPAPVAPASFRGSIPAPPHTEPPIMGGSQEGVDFNDADALVRRALQDISAEDVVAAADELLLEASADDILSASGEGLAVHDEDIADGLERAFDTKGAAARPAPAVPEEDEIDRLAREAVADANKSLARNNVPADVAATTLMGLSDRELDELRAFEEDGKSNGALTAPSSSFSQSSNTTARNVAAKNFTAVSSSQSQSQSSSGAFARPTTSPALPPEMSARDDFSEGFDDPTLALMPSQSSDLPTDERPRRAPPGPATQPSLLVRSSSSGSASDPPRSAQGSHPPQNGMDIDDDAPTLFVRPADLMGATPDAATRPAQKAAPASLAVPPPTTTAPPPVVNDFSDEFDPSSFDLPADVKELLRQGAADADALPDAPTLKQPMAKPAPAKGLDIAMEPVEVRPPPLSQTGAPIVDTKSSPPSMSSSSMSSSSMSSSSMSSSSMSSSSSGSSKASVPAAVTNVGAAPPGAKSLQAAALPPEMASGDEGFSEASSGEITLRGKLGLADKAHGFENDPANQFFPDELEEAEFFIQNELLDEAKEILAQILDDVPDSARAQWMVARIDAREKGEAEPPAPWEQRILEEVQAQLEDLGLAEDNATKQTPGLSPDGSVAQISVEEVLSQFKKGVAETVPEDDAATHYELGIAYKEMGLHDDAVGEFQIASRAPSRAVDSRFMIGTVRREQGNLDEAVKAYEEAAAQPNATKNQQAAADYERGVCLEELSRLDDALDAFRRAKANGHAAPDLDRRITALIAKGVKGGKNTGGNGSNGNGANGANGASKPGSTPPTRGPKNIDYL